MPPWAGIPAAVHAGFLAAAFPMGILVEVGDPAVAVVDTSAVADADNKPIRNLSEVHRSVAFIKSLKPQRSRARTWLVSRCCHSDLCSGS